MPFDLGLFLLKGVGLGAIVGWLCCHYGLQVKSSPTEVPQQASRAVVMSLLCGVVYSTFVTALFYWFRRSPHPLASVHCPSASGAAPRRGSSSAHRRVRIGRRPSRVWRSLCSIVHRLRECSDRGPASSIACSESVGDRGPASQPRVRFVPALGRRRTERGAPGLVTMKKRSRPSEVAKIRRGDVFGATGRDTSGDARSAA